MQTVYTESEKQFDKYSLGPVYTAPFSYENGVKLIRFRPAFTLLRCENGAFPKQ